MNCVFEPIAGDQYRCQNCERTITTTVLPIHARCRASAEKPKRDPLAFAFACGCRGPVLGSIASDLCGQAGQRRPIAACARFGLCTPTRCKKRPQTAVQACLTCPNGDFARELQT